MDTGSREENASNQNHGVPLLIPSEAKLQQAVEKVSNRHSGAQRRCEPGIQPH
jgi:hypothetical protein